MEFGKIIKIFCDGSSSFYDDTRTLVGSYAILVLEYDIDKNKHEILYEESNGEIDWSNNIGELNGLLASFKYIKSRVDRYKRKFVIYSDSEYAIKSTLYYIKKWSCNGYKLRDGSPVKNSDLMKEIYQAFYVDLKDVDITIQWIKGHQNSKQINAFYNNVVDIKAKQTKKEVYKKYLKKT